MSEVKYSIKKEGDNPSDTKVHLNIDGVPLCLSLKHFKDSKRLSLKVLGKNLETQEQEELYHVNFSLGWVPQDDPPDPNAKKIINLPNQEPVPKQYPKNTGGYKKGHRNKKKYKNGHKNKYHKGHKYDNKKTNEKNKKLIKKKRFYGKRKKKIRKKRRAKANNSGT